MTEDRFASYDAAYVLGALSAKDRQEYEQHLHDCASCASSVRELAGIPGLLRQVPADVAEDGERDGPPDTLLPDLLARVDTSRRRSRLVTIGTGVLAAAACLVLAVVLALRPFGRPETPVAIPTATMSPVRSAPLYATVGLEDVAWGTKVNMHCMYEKGSKVWGDGRYYLVAITDDGTVDHLGSWTAQPGKVAKLQAATSWSVRDISAVEVRTGKGSTVLRLRP